MAVQAAVLFGGHDLILRTDGLTYAEHARRGFFELEAVAALALGVIAATARWARRERPADERLARALLGLLCALTLVVLASALSRLWLYVDAYGATRLRFLVQAQLLWLAAVFLALLVAGALRAERRLPRIAVALRRSRRSPSRPPTRTAGSRSATSTAGATRAASTSGTRTG